MPGKVCKFCDRKFMMRNMNLKQIKNIESENNKIIETKEKLEDAKDEVRSIQTILSAMKEAISEED